MLSHQALAVLVISLAAGVVLGSGDIVAADAMESVEALMDVTPQIPDGPVVQQYQKMLEKKKLAAEIERQKALMGPALARGDAKKLAKKREMEMLAEVEIKNRIGKKEIALKKKEKDDARALKARKEAAKARRLERYEKWSHDEVLRNNEKLAKLHQHTAKSLAMAKRLFKRKKGSKKSAVESMAKARAAQSQELRVGGYMQLKGQQVNIEPLTRLNDALAHAMKNPEEYDPEALQKAYNEAVAYVTTEETGFANTRQGYIDDEKAAKAKTEREEKGEQADRLQKIKDSIAEQRREQQKLKDDLAKATDNAKQKKDWEDAFANVKKARNDVIMNERHEKDTFQMKVLESEFEKSDTLPGKEVERQTKNLDERSNKFNGAQHGDAATAYIARRMRMRACESLEAAFVAEGKYMDTVLPTKLRNINQYQIPEETAGGAPFDYEKYGEKRVKQKAVEKLYQGCTGKDVGCDAGQGQSASGCTKVSCKAMATATTLCKKALEQYTSGPEAGCFHMKDKSCKG